VGWQCRCASTARAGGRRHLNRHHRVPRPAGGQRGTPITDTVNMEFRLYDVPTGGAPLWSELWTGTNAVRVSDGLFNVMLGSLTQIPQSVIAGHDQLWLGITVGTDDEMTPRVQLGACPSRCRH